MTARLSPLSTICGLLLPVFIFGCGSAQKQRLELREKLAASSGMYCEFISGDVHSDIDVELNMQMAKRCEPTKPLSITNYKNSSENYGVIYCCSIKKDEPKKVTPHNPAPSAPAAVAKKNSDELDLSDDAPMTPAEKKSDKPALPPKTNPTTLNNPAAPSSKPAPAPAAAKPASSAPASASTTSAPPAAKPSSPAAQSTAPQNSPKSPSKTPDTPETDILGE